MKFPSSIEQETALGAAWLSRVCVEHPYLIGRHIVGLPTEQFTPLSYRVSQTLLREVGSFAAFNGNPKSGRLPKNYKTAGVISVAHEVLIPQGVTETVPAIGFAMGERLLIAQIPDDELVAGVNVHKFALRIGREDPSFVAGYMTNDLSLYCDGIIVPGSVYPVDEVPVGIPLH